MRQKFNMTHIKKQALAFSGISISGMRETSSLIEECGDGSSPSEAHSGGWEGLGKYGREPVL
jgi:hypothetical protein